MTFFVINKAESPEYVYNTRSNVLALVKYGFSREEIYSMPLSEMIEYIQIIHESSKNSEMPVISRNEELEALNGIKMAGNTVSGQYF